MITTTPESEILVASWLNIVDNLDVRASEFLEKVLPEQAAGYIIHSEKNNLQSAYLTACARFSKATDKNFKHWRSVWQILSEIHQKECQK